MTVSFTAAEKRRWDALDAAARRRAAAETDILAVLADGPLSLDQLLARMRSRRPQRPVVVRILAELVDAGVLEQFPPDQSENLETRWSL